MPVAEADSFRIKNSIASMHRLTTMILGNESNNKIVPIHDRVCVNSPPYYLNWFEISYPNVPPNIYDGSLCLQCMNGIKVKFPAVLQCHRILDAVVTIMK